MADGAKPEDFDITKYGHDRAHELELNKFTHALEVEQLKLMILLNGGAAAALLTFAERATYPLTREGLFWPVVFWLGGLSAGAAATIITRKRQAAYSKAYRYRRHATEWRQLLKKNVKPADRVGLPDDKERAKLRGTGDSDFDAADKINKGDILYDKVATLVRKNAAWWGRWIFSLSLVSIALFLAGAVTATLVATR